ncbi:MAG: 6-phosphofructokinase [Gammaproteobacteria bacterium]|nr:6-phosphofructokinase [Gammaproteobacteria bacterium]
MPAPNALYAQSGGPTAVINATAQGVIEAVRRARPAVGKLYAARNGILGALHEQLLDTDAASAEAVTALGQRPGSAFGTARYKLARFEDDEREYHRLIDVFRAHGIGMVFFNGGNDSMDTALKLSELGRRLNYPLQCIGLPKTVDNDLPVTDCCPGFGSAAKYVAVSTREAALDVAGMARTSTKVFILEVMGRHAGWIAAAGGLAGSGAGDAPHIILFPEVPFEADRFLERVRQSVQRHEYCVIVASEGARYADGRFLSEAGGTDAFGHKQLGGLAPVLANMVRERLGYKHHYAISDYLQRSARHLASATDLEHAFAAGRTGVEMAVEGGNAVMVTIKRTGDDPYTWETSAAPLDQIANREKELPRGFITDDGYGITAAARTYLQPLVEGEALPPFRGGLPVYEEIDLPSVEKRLPAFD